MVLQFVEWNLRPAPKYQLQKVWVQVLGVPLKICDFPSFCAIGLIIGIALRVDMESVRKNNLVGMLVGALDVDAIPSSVEIVVGESVYDIFFKVEDSVVDTVDEVVDRGDDHEDGGNPNRGKDVEMEDRESKRLKNNSDNSAHEPESRKGQASSNFKGNNLGLVASDTIWVMPRASQKETEMGTLEDGVLILHVQSRSLVTDKSDQGDDNTVALDGCHLESVLKKGEPLGPIVVEVVESMVELVVLTVQKEEPIVPGKTTGGVLPRSLVVQPVYTESSVRSIGVLKADILVAGEGIEKLTGTEVCQLSQIVGGVSVKGANVAESFDAEVEPCGLEGRQLGLLDGDSPSKTKAVQIIGPQVEFAPQLDGVWPGTDGLGTDRREAEGQEVGEDAQSTKSSRVCKPAIIHHVIDAGDHRQSERLKNHNSGDEDIVQKAKRRVQIRNLEFEPSKSNNNMSFLSFSDEQIIDKVASIGISLGTDDVEIASSINNIKNIEYGRMKKKGSVDVEEVETENEDDNDLSTLNHLFSGH